MLDRGGSVKTLTRDPNREDPFGGKVSAYPLDFSDQEGLRRSIEGAVVLYNTYWIRFGQGRNTFEQAAESSRTLFAAATEAGVGRIVHFSVANALDRSKAALLQGQGTGGGDSEGRGYPIRYHPAHTRLVEGDLLLNNMTWALRRFPVFPLFARSDYKVHPIYAGDLAAQAVAAGAWSDSFVADAAGPETFTFEELLRLLASMVGARVLFVHTPPSLGFVLTRLVVLLMRDMVLTQDEVNGLMAGLLTSDGVPTGTTGLYEWLDTNGAVLGTRYVSELRRNFSLKE